MMGETSAHFNQSNKNTLINGFKDLEPDCKVNGRLIFFFFLLNRLGCVVCMDAPCEVKG
jgi:hypothetical protein